MWRPRLPPGIAALFRCQAKRDRALVQAGAHEDALAGIAARDLGGALLALNIYGIIAHDLAGAIGLASPLLFATDHAFCR